jgi:hypothetical protein
MIDYQLDELGWFEFEQLIQTLGKARLGFGIEAWGGRGDWGRDAYYQGKLRYPTNAETEGAFVFQSKFVEGANAAGAKSDKLITTAVRKECTRIQIHLDNGTWDKAPVCYALFTNAPATPGLRNSLSAAIKAVLPSAHCSVHDGHDVCQWLRLSPEIVRSFPQLLSLRDLQELLRQTVHAEVIVRSKGAITLAQSYSRVFVPTNAYYLQQPAQRLRTTIEDTLIHVAAQHLGSFAYSDGRSFRTFFELCQALMISPSIDLSDAWDECLADAEKWLNDRWVIWQDDAVPGCTADFVRTVQEFCPSELQRPAIRQKLQRVINDLLERAGEEKNSDYDEPKGEDELRERADAFETVGKAFKKLSELPLWAKQEQQSLAASANHFACEADMMLVIRTVDG